MKAGGFKTIKMKCDGETLAEWGLTKTNSQAESAKDIRPNNCTIMLQHIVTALYTLDNGWLMADGFGSINSIIAKNANTDTAHVSGISSNMEYKYFRPDMFTVLHHAKGYKLLLMYIYEKDSNASSGLRNIDHYAVGVNSSKSYAPDKPDVGGICMSILPKESTEDFDKDDYSSSDFIPNDATPLTYTAGYSACMSYTSNNTLGNLSFYFSSKIDDDTCIINCYQCVTGTKPRIFTTGTIFETTLDSGASSKYGSIIWTTSTSSPWFDDSRPDTDYDCLYDNRDNNLCDLLYEYRYRPRLAFHCDQGWVSGSGKVNSVSMGAGLLSTIPTYSRNICTSERFAASPLAAEIWTGDSNATFYVGSEGNDFKGWLRRDLIRCTVKSYTADAARKNVNIPAYGCLVDNGNYIHLGKGFMMGWDPSNTKEVNPFYVEPTE